MNKSVYTRPKKPTRIRVTRRTVEGMMQNQVISKPVMISASSECHVTPPDVAERMAKYLGYRKKILEPSAGTGNLIMEIKSDEIIAIEIDRALCGLIEKRTGIKPLCEDFLEYNQPEAFSGVIMNPPFSEVEKHIKKALECLKPTGFLVSIVPITFKNEKHGAYTIEELPSDTFSYCRVNTKIISIIK